MGPKQRNMKVGGISKYQCEVNFWNREKCLKYPRVKHFPRVEGGNIRKKKNKQNITRIQPPAMGQKDSTVWEYKILELFVRAVPTFLPTYLLTMYAHFSLSKSLRLSIAQKIPTLFFNVSRYTTVY